MMPLPTRVPLRTGGRIAIVPVASIVRIDADDNYVRVRADREYRLKSTLTRMLAHLDPTRFVRVHRSHAVNMHAVRELRPLHHGEFAITLADGTSLRSSRSYHRAIREALRGALVAP